MIAIIATRLNSLPESLAAQTTLLTFYGQGYDSIVTESQPSLQLVIERLGVLKRHNIDSVMLFGSIGITEEMLAHWQSSPVPLACDTKGFASVCYDDEGVIKILTQRLYDQRHRNISYLGVLYSDVTAGKRRHEAYLTPCRAHRLHPVAALPGLAMK